MVHRYPFMTNVAATWGKEKVHGLRLVTWQDVEKSSNFFKMEGYRQPSSLVKQQQEIPHWISSNFFLSELEAQKHSIGHCPDMGPAG